MCSLFDNKWEIMEIFENADIANYLGYQENNTSNLIIENIGKKIGHYYSIDLSRKSNSSDWWQIICDSGYIDNVFHWQLKKEFALALSAQPWTDEPDYYALQTTAIFDDNNELLQTEFVEWTKKRTVINRYERNQEARDACIKHYGAMCYIWDFDFEKIYGSIGKGFIHVHHEADISLIGSEYSVDPIKDLKPVCPNCHAMLHQKRPAYTIDELKKIIKHD